MLTNNFNENKSSDSTAYRAEEQTNFARACEVLHQYFGYDSFRVGQEGVVKAILSRQDVLAVMPTGAGKSLCYQVPGIIFKGLTIVVSPLVSLMDDQVRSLLDVGVRGAYLNSTLTPSQQSTVLLRALQGRYEIMYVAPERLGDSRFLEFAKQANLSLLAVDEAHCVSQWGQDFRPSYLTIGDFIAKLPCRPVVAAFTATATARVQEDVIRLLGLSNPYQVVTGFDRPNLHFSVERLEPKRKRARLVAYALNHPHESGIVYCSTRKDVEKVYEAICEAGICATRYHAGMSTAAREKSQHAFITDDASVMVATNAFGMGIDKSNVRYVLHYNMPGSIEAYYQEAGRAGRDSETSKCLMFWCDSDVATCRYFIERELENEELTAAEADAVRASRRRLLEAMCGYCLTTDCLRSYILNYFAEGALCEESTHNPVAASCCSNCDGHFEAIEVTDMARSIMRCVHELRGGFGKGVVVDVLRGAKTSRVRELALDEKISYGTLKASASQIKEVIELLSARGYLQISEGMYPVVGWGPFAREVAREDFSLTMKRIVHKQDEKRSGNVGGARESFSANLRSLDGILFEKLRALRKKLADEAKVPPYIVFSDATLRDMCAKLPQNKEEFLEVNGVGATKLERYGSSFLTEINAHAQD